MRQIAAVLLISALGCGGGPTEPNHAGRSTTFDFCECGAAPADPAKCAMYACDSATKADCDAEPLERWEVTQCFFCSASGDAPGVKCGDAPSAPKVPIRHVDSRCESGVKACSMGRSYLLECEGGVFFSRWCGEGKSCGVDAAGVVGCY
jgi:hypothetical protein